MCKLNIYATSTGLSRRLPDTKRNLPSSHTGHEISWLQKKHILKYICQISFFQFLAFWHKIVEGLTPFCG